MSKKIDQAGRVAAYVKDYPGRSPFHDALAGLLCATPVFLGRWLQDHVVSACKRALAGKVSTGFPELPGWVRGIAMQHLACEARLWLRYPSALAPLRFDGFIREMLDPRPLSSLVNLINAHARVVQSARGKLEGS
jgi:hypothetical protein